MKQQILDAIKNNKLEINWEQYDFDGYHILHKVEGFEDDVEVGYPEIKELQHLREDLEDEKLYGEGEQGELYWEILDEIEYILSGGLDDVFDYDAEPKIYVNGVEL